jgi:NNP family nitrate/nitrite transporter-like MFS transporter
MPTTGNTRAEATAKTPPPIAAASRNLIVATNGFTVNFWAWALLGPLGPGVKERLGLSFAAQSLLVAVPVLVGSLGRIPVGALTDRYGARIMIPLISLATIAPVLTLIVWPPPPIPPSRWADWPGARPGPDRRRIKPTSR